MKKVTKKILSSQFNFEGEHGSVVNARHDPRPYRRQELEMYWSLAMKLMYNRSSCTLIIDGGSIVGIVF